MIRLGINGYFWDKPFTGSGQYTRELWRALHADGLLGDDLRATMLHPPRQPIVGDGDAAIGAHFQARSRLPLRGDNLRELWWEQVGLGGTARMLGLNLLHSPYMAAPLVAPAPTIVTVHDLIPLRLPEYRGSLSFRLYLRLATAAARRARLLLTDSEHSRRDIIALLHVPEERVRVTYLAVGEQYRPASAEQQAATRAKFGLPAGYIFYIGGFDARKNVSGLLRAFAALPALDPAPTLAIAGQPPDAVARAVNPALFPDVQAEATRLGLDDRVLWLGRVSDADKAALYAAAGLFVFPSLYEGFGLDPLEALASGTPLVCSAATSLPEVVGDAGVLVDAHDPAALSAAMHAILTDPACAARLRALGPPQAARFNWAHTAVQTVAAYRSVVQV